MIEFILLAHTLILTTYFLAKGEKARHAHLMAKASFEERQFQARLSGKA
jgi:hypothetical protein